jgi:hypothetical protein
MSYCFASKSKWAVIAIAMRKERAASIAAYIKSTISLS